MTVWLSGCALSDRTCLHRAVRRPVECLPLCLSSLFLYSSVSAIYLREIAGNTPREFEGRSLYGYIRIEDLVSRFLTFTYPLFHYYIPFLMRCPSTSSLIAFILPLSAPAAAFVLPDADVARQLQLLNNGVKGATDSINALHTQIALISANVGAIAFARDMDRVFEAVTAGERPADAEYVDTAHLHARHSLTVLLTA